MRAFLQQVSDSDALAESGLKVIAYFDALVEHRATLEACVRAAAALSRCVAGLRDAGSSASIRFNRRGVAAEGLSTPTTARPVRIGDRDVGEVWLERKDGPAALDELIVERMAMAAGVLWRGSPRPRTSVSALVEAAVGQSTAADDRRRALGLLGLSPERPLDVLAVSSIEPDELVASLRSLQDAVRDSGRIGSWAGGCATLLGNVGIVLAQPGSPSTLPEGLVAGLVRGASVAQLPETWARAQTALRFCRLLGFGNVVDHAELGALAALAELAPGAAATNPDLRAIREMTATTRGRAALEALEQRVVSGSVRETAAALFLHHSSVRYRLKHAEECLGVDLQDPRGRLRAELAVVLWRLTTG